MLQDSGLLAEAQRQFMICSACRYCEGYCATFPAIEARTEYEAADVAYIANVCHDCRACYQACMYTSPHPFAVDIPKLLTELRVETYEERSAPAGVRAGSGWAVAACTLVAIAALLAAIALGGRWPNLTAADDSAGAFYRIVPFLWMVVPALVLSIVALVAVIAAARKLVRDVLPQTGVRVADWIGAWKDGLSLAYMKGGTGGGCYYPDVEKPSTGRRTFHIVLVCGVTLAFAATVAGAVMQDLLGQMPPFSFVSAPVILGTLGGIGIVVGAGGLLALKVQRNGRVLDVRSMIGMDVVFLITLITVGVTGLALLALRSTPFLGPLLVIHLGVVAALFVTAPYGKFIHVPLRLAALAIFHYEEAAGAKTES
jgi:citrate/tricarballylate utilization protein